MITKRRARVKISEAMKSACDNVCGGMVLPDIQAETNNQFPYVCLIENDERIETNQQTVAGASFSVMGYVKGDKEDLIEKRNDLEDKIFWAFQNLKGLNLRVDSINNRNIYRPWGLEAGVYFPYAAFRMEIKLPYVKREGDEEPMDWQALDARYLKKAGDNMAGNLGIGSDGKWTVKRDGDKLVFAIDGVAKIRYNPATNRLEAVYESDFGRDPF